MAAETSSGLNRRSVKGAALGSIGDMTKKNFVALAEALRANVPNEDSNCYDAEALLFENILTSVMDVCQRANPRFDRARFAAAVGLDEIQRRRALVEAA
jgi:hypothetical protein